MGYFRSFKDLSLRMRAGVDYQIRTRPTIPPSSSSSSPTIVIAAIHGGSIETHTSEIATSIAGSDFALYLFEGLTTNGAHEDLHLTSHLFDEPQGCELVRKAEIVVVVHGCHDNHGSQVLVGGRDVRLRDKIASVLNKERFGAVVRGKGEKLAGFDENNICNRGSLGAGVQLEISSGLRNKLNNDKNQLSKFSAAVREAILVQREEGPARI